MVLDLMHMYNFHGQMVAGLKIVTFGADMGSCVDADNKNKDILVLGKGPKGGLDDTLITAEAK